MVEKCLKLSKIMRLWLIVVEKCLKSSNIIRLWLIVVDCGRLWLIVQKSVEVEKCVKLWKIMRLWLMVVDCGRLWLIVHNCAQLCNLVPASCVGLKEFWSGIPEGLGMGTG